MCWYQTARPPRRMGWAGGRPVISKQRERLIKPGLEGVEWFWHPRRTPGDRADDASLEPLILQVETTSQEASGGTQWLQQEGKCGRSATRRSGILVRQFDICWPQDAIAAGGVGEARIIEVRA